MSLFRYVANRLLFVLPQLFSILCISFFLVKLIPGDPAILMLGPSATKEAVENLREELGLTKPLPMQFVAYMERVAHGDLGKSWQSTNPVVDDLMERFPATLELVTLGLLLAILIGFPLGVVSAARPRGIVARVADVYGMLAGALPDFWLALILVFLFYTMLQIAPPPLGRLDIALVAPDVITGSLLIDSILAGDTEVLWSVLAHLALPVLTLGLINAGPILKMTTSAVGRTLSSDYIRFSRMCGLPGGMILRQAIRVALPSIITIISVLYGVSIGGAVLVEIVFAWGGAGQYAVQGVLNSDLNPVLGFVVFAAILSLVVYLVVDLLYFVLDPRMRG